MGCSGDIAHSLGNGKTKGKLPRGTVADAVSGEGQVVVN